MHSIEINALTYPRIVFMGTPEFAVASLDALVKAGYPVVAVITAPDKPAGRGMHLQQSAVKKYAVDHRIPVLQPEKLKSPTFLENLRSYKADLQVVVAFRMLPEVVWNMPPMGTLNVHGSLLPQYRGAAPINWAIINGEKETGVTTFRLKHEIDTGDILMQQSLPISPDETAGELHDRMKKAGAQLLVITLEGLVNGSLHPLPQTAAEINTVLKHAPKIFTDTCRIDVNRTVNEVHNLVRGLSPFPGAFTTLDGKMLKVYRSAKATNIAQEGKPGQWLTDGKQQLLLCCGGGWLQIEELQVEGKKRMTTADFLRGYRIWESSQVKLM
jgi:methionyl-tRNA formyltransferase